MDQFRISICMILLMLAGLTSQAQDKIFTKDQLLEDFDLLRYNIEVVHAGLYVYTTEKKLEATFDGIREKIDGPMTEVEFFRLLTPLLGVIANGHSEIVPSRAYFDSIRTKVKVLPFDLYFDEDKLYVLRNNSLDTSIMPGYSLDKINGKETVDILNNMIGKMTKDGFNESFPRERLVQNFSTRYLFYYDHIEEFSCTMTKPNGEVTEVKVEGLLMSDIKKNREERYDVPQSFWSSGKPPYTLDFEEETAIMTLKTFDKKTIKKRNKKSKKWFEESFAEINKKGAKKLIIDMRGNGGGDPEPTIELFSHLHDKPFTFYKGMYTVTNKIPNGKLYDEPIWILNTYTKFKLRKSGDKYHVKNVAGLKPYQPAKEQFTGEVLVLIDAMSFSATGEMAAILKEHDRVTFIGEETGGNPNQNTSGMMLPLHLPNTQVRAIIPVVVFEMNVNFENTGRGVIPDIPMRNSIEDEIAGKDSVMEFAKAFN